MTRSVDQLTFYTALLCGSMTFAKKMKGAKTLLEKEGHIVTIPTNTDLHEKDPSFVDKLSENLQHCIDDDVLRANFQLVADSDAIVVLNYPKNDIDGYLGTSTLMEIGLAHFLKKKIFLLFPIPNYDNVRWAHEVSIMGPIILNGNLRNVM